MSKKESNPPPPPGSRRPPPPPPPINSQRENPFLAADSFENSAREKFAGRLPEGVRIIEADNLRKGVWVCYARFIPYEHEGPVPVEMVSPEAIVGASSGPHRIAMKTNHSHYQMAVRIPHDQDPEKRRALSKAINRLRDGPGTVLCDLDTKIEIIRES